MPANDMKIYDEITNKLITEADSEKDVKICANLLL